MRNAQDWRPTKFVESPAGLRGSRDAVHLPASSLVTADAVARKYEQMLRDHAKGKLLDVGAGMAPLYGVYRNLVDEVICIDWSDSPYVDVQANLNEPLPFEENSFDTVLITDVLEHLPKPQMMFDEAARVLKPRGKLLVGVPFFYWIHERPHDYHRYTRFMLEHLCEQAALSVVQIEATGGSPEVIADMICKHSSVVPMLGSLTGHVLAGAMRLWPLSALSEKTTTWYPLGYTLVAESPTDTE